MIAPRYSALTAAVIVLGVSGIAAQTVLLREMLVLFSGNEFSLGVVIGSWVVAEALGALAGGRLDRFITRKTEAFLLLTALFTLAFPLAIHLTRIFKHLAGIPVEMGVGYGAILWGSLLLMLPAGFLHGFLFILACSLHGSNTGDGASSVGRVYYIDTLGIIAGGIATSYLLIPRYSSIAIAAVILILNAAACCALARARGRWGVAGACSLLFLLLGVAAVVAGVPNLLDRWSVGEQWRGKKVVSSSNSFYQNITVVQDEDQYTFFTDGRPLITTPVPDIAFAEEFAHLPLLSHPRPERVLVISGGAGGMINEILKHPSVALVDYVELDPQLLATLGEHPTSLTLRELRDPRVKLHLEDGRSFLRSSPAANYDVIFLGLPPPHSLQENRFFTAEFFVQARRAARPGGIFALAAPGSLTYYSDELRNVNSSIRSTLAAAFPRLHVVPGETNVYLASSAADFGSVAPGLLAERLGERGIETLLVNRQQLEYRLDPEPRRWFEGAVPPGGELNRDVSPVTLYHTIAYHNLQFSPWMHRLYAPLARHGFAAALGAAAIGIILCATLRRPSKRFASTYAIATTGFSAMLFELMLFNGFQVYYGQVYYAAGILITAFMAGIAAGSHLAVRRLPQVADPARALALQEGGLVLFALFLAAVHVGLEAFPVASPGSVYGLFLPLLFLSGLLPGMEFPVANAMCLHSGARGGSSSDTAGLIYGADLLGGWVGGIAAGFFLLPVLGLYRSLAVLALLKLGSLLLVVRSRRTPLQNLF